MSRARLAAALAAVAAALVGLALLGALVGASRVVWRADRDGAARLRLSWQSASARVETCRPATEAELAALPPHMRTPEICEGRLLPYRLRIWIDGHLRIDERVAPRGARGDRPLSVLHELPLEPGSHSLRVVFEPEPDAEGAALAEEVALPEPHTLRATLELEPREVALVTRGSEGLVLRRRDR